MGLSRREHLILLDIAKITRLKRIESIFTMVTAFDRGAAELTKNVLARRGAKTSKNLSAQLSVLREKLGFEKKRPALAANLNKSSSKQIPTGKQLHMTRRKAGDETDIESTVIENNDVETARFLFKQYENPQSLEKINEFTETLGKDLLIIDQCSYSHSDKTDAVGFTLSISLYFGALPCAGSNIA